MTIWDILENSFVKHLDVPALEYFKREIFRPDFTDSVYTWASLMLSPQKELVTFLNYIEQLKNRLRVPRTNKYIWIDQSKKDGKLLYW